MSALDDLQLGPEFMAALTYSGVAVLVRTDPDDPDHIVMETYRLVPARRERRVLAADDVAAALRRAADQIEAAGNPL